MSFSLYGQSMILLDKSPVLSSFPFWAPMISSWIKRGNHGPRIRKRSTEAHLFFGGATSFPISYEIGKDGLLLKNECGLSIFSYGCEPRLALSALRSAASQSSTAEEKKDL